MAQNQQPVNGTLAPQNSRAAGTQPMYIVLVDENGNAFSAGSVVLTGYVIADAAAPVAATDTVAEAFGKLEKRVADLEAAAG